MVLSLLNWILAIVLLIMNTYPSSATNVDYSSTCTCNSASSGVCMSYSCTTTVGSASCFPASSQIALEDGSFKDLSDIKIGDQVLVNEDGMYEPVLAFIHESREGLFEFLAISTLSSKSNKSSTIFVSGNHLLFDFDSKQARFAGSFRKGERLQLIENAQVIAGEIINVRLTKQKGYYAPLTPSGTLVVDGVLASNYATVSNHDLAHTMMGIYRMWISLVGSVENNSEMHWILQLMLTAEKILRWSGAQMFVNNNIYDGTFEVSSLVGTI